MGTNENEPGLREQTRELGKTLRQLMAADPTGSPSDKAAAVFQSWVSVAGPESRDSRCFTDVAENYPVQANTNKDLFELFNFLEGYLEREDEEDASPEPPRTFIGLPLIDSH